jgi:hypothetical protein
MAPMKKLARSLKERIDNIVTYCTHKITNAVAEGINSKIMSIKRRAGGYRKILTHAVLTLPYVCGGRFHLQVNQDTETGQRCKFLNATMDRSSC